MIPLRDVIPSRTTPWVTFLLIGINLLVFGYELMLPSGDRAQFFMAFGLTPSEFTWANVFTSMFIHGGFVHIGGNLLSLWIFGDNVEDRMGHARYLLFYLLAGLVAGLAQTYALPESTVPVVGASGAIAGVMGAYLLLFPRSRVLVLVFLFIFVDVVEIPAMFFLGFWFLSQLLSGVGQLAHVPGANIGFWAHIGGFLAGLAGGWLLQRPERREVDWWSNS